MICTQDKIEQVVIGTLLNDYGDDGLYERNKVVLRNEMFSDIRNRFLFDTLQKMKAEGQSDTTPLNVLMYLQEKQVVYGDTKQLVLYMMDVAQNYAWKTFDEWVTQLAQLYIQRMRRG